MNIINETMTWLLEQKQNNPIPTRQIVLECTARMAAIDDAVYRQAGKRKRPKRRTRRNHTKPDVLARDQ